MLQLGIPDAVTEAQGFEPFEILRAWISEKGAHYHVLLENGNAEVWGITLADIARQISRELGKFDGTSPPDELDKIEAAFRIELNAQSPRV